MQPDEEVLRATSGPAAKARLPAPKGLPVESGDIVQVKAAILDKYGFTPTDEYCRDLIAFVEELTRYDARD